MKKEIKNAFIEDGYLKKYEDAANGCWYVEEYFKISHVERREARNSTFVKKGYLDVEQ